jgi:hypothetical protein
LPQKANLNSFIFEAKIALSWNIKSELFLDDSNKSEANNEAMFGQTT